MRREKLGQKAALRADMHHDQHGGVQVRRESGNDRSQSGKAAERCTDDDDVTMTCGHVDDLDILLRFPGRTFRSALQETSLHRSPDAGVVPKGIISYKGPEGASHFTWLPRKSR
ncbi:hypothetical protein [Caballeronia sp. LZ031]|uniref:hypothetical protein n=1 Tax=Caballeronia sp. LZ031 TaxID=3038556 RepID=UPI0028665202|nr:hypothetical protein [Caballeronia sp. LZ031]MDR5752331.1 hypothetical protein [Caballeronia sp. LZ024]MDR5841849.1 hypothetical protein [Caballeronia sp. LZ031]